MLTVLRVSNDERASALPTAALRNTHYLERSRGVISGVTAMLLHLDHTCATVLLDCGCSRSCIIANSAHSTAKRVLGRLQRRAICNAACAWR